MIIGTLTGVGSIQGRLSPSGDVKGRLDIPRQVPVDDYDGPYQFVPTNQTQTIQIQGKKAVSNITVAAIPNNYGLIVWNGSTLIVR